MSERRRRKERDGDKRVDTGQEEWRKRLKEKIIIELGMEISHGIVYYIIYYIVL